MTFNPYAPPDDNFFNSAGPPQQPQGAPQGWEIEEVLRAAWERYKSDWITIQFSVLLAFAPGQIMGMMNNAIVQRFGFSPLSSEAIWISIGVSLLGMLVNTYFHAGLIRLLLRSVRGQDASFGQLFSGGGVYFTLLGANLLMMIGIFAGTLLLIVPGIILALGLMLTQYFVVDAGMGPIEAMGASWDAMRGHKGQMFLFGLVCFVIMMVSLCTCIGIFAAQAVFYVALAIIYTRISGRMVSVTDPPSPYGQNGPTGGYGAGPMPPPGGGWGAA